MFLIRKPALFFHGFTPVLHSAELANSRYIHPSVVPPHSFPSLELRVPSSTIMPPEHKMSLHKD